MGFAWFTKLFKRRKFETKTEVGNMDKSEVGFHRFRMALKKRDSLILVLKLM
jgi:hypothetical protein